MNKLLILSAMALLLPIVPALACFPSEESEAKDEKIAFQFGRDPIPMSFCELPEPGFVVVNGKCYDFDAITDFDTEEECQADDVCKAYREDQKERQEEPEPRPPCQPSGDLDVCIPWEDEEIIEEPIGDPNHGEIKGDEELGQDQEQDEEEHQEEEEQGQETTEETTAETSE